MEDSRAGQAMSHSRLEVAKVDPPTPPTFSGPSGGWGGWGGYARFIKEILEEIRTLAIRQSGHQLFPSRLGFGAPEGGGGGGLGFGLKIFWGKS